jgi:Gas vesicle synthesis protein GvpL/GvpF
VIRLYAFVSGLRDLPPAEPESPLEALHVGPLTAVVARADQAPESRDDVLRHGLVVEALLDCADAVLPARFGERFADADALDAAVRARRDELARRLDDVSGCVELAVRVVRATPEQPRADDGTAYMEARLRSVAADASAAAEIHDALRRRARAAVAADAPRAGVLHEAGYLVERAGVAAFVTEVERLAATHPELTVVCTGPWAPATFGGAA